MILCSLGGEVMPRATRKVSCSGSYSIMIRGINRERFFKADGDKRKYIQLVNSPQDRQLMQTIC